MMDFLSKNKKKDPEKEALKEIMSGVMPKMKDGYVSIEVEGIVDKGNKKKKNNYGM